MRGMRIKLTLLVLLLALPLGAQDFARDVDKAVADVLASTGAPSASVAIVKDGKIAYAHAYGNARLDPPMAATPEMRYSIGSVSKQFTATAILMLAEEGKLSLDDRVVRWLSGFTTENDIYPDERAAVVVAVNLDASPAVGQIASRISSILFAPAESPTTAVARKILEGLQKGQIDRALFTSNANAYFSETALKDFAASLGPLGAIQDFAQTGQSLRGGMTLRRYRAKLGAKIVRITTFWMPDGKLEQFQLAAAE